MSTKLKQARERMGMSQRELAEKLEVPQSSLADWERGHSPMSAAALARLSRLLRERGSAEEAGEIEGEWWLTAIDRVDLVGAPCLCPGDLDEYEGLMSRAAHPPTTTWSHGVRRRPGQYFCPKHGSYLITACLRCGFSLGLLGELEQRCPGCGYDFNELQDELIRHGVLRQKYEELQDQRVGLFRTNDRESVPSSSRHRENREPTVAEQIQQHNRAVGKTRPEDLTERERMHYEVAKELQGSSGDAPITRKAFLEKYRERVPGAPDSTVLPADFCAGAVGDRSRQPFFLRRSGRGKYRFAGLDGEACS